MNTYFKITDLLIILTLLAGIGYILTIDDVTTVIDGNEYKCSVQSETQQRCFEKYTNSWGLPDYRLALEYNPQTKQVIALAQ